MARQALQAGYSQAAAAVYLDESVNLQAVTTAGFANEDIANPTITPTVGALAITGTAPVVTATLNVAVTPSVGAAAIAGQTPIVTLGGAISIQPTVGATTITGTTPIVTVTASMLITPSAGALAFTGATPIVTTTDVALQLGLSVGDDLECYTGLVHWRAGMGIGGIEAILYTGPV